MFSIRLADHYFGIENKYRYFFWLCQRYFTDAEPEVLISATDDEILREQTGSYSPGYLELLAIHRKIAEYLIDDATLLFHGSAVAVDNEAYLLAAPSGTGKSTHARLWREHFGSRAVMINDDKPLLKMTDGGVIAYGTPWDGKHHLSTNTSAPLKAICFLERSETNRIEPLPQSEAYPLLLRQSYRPADPAKLKKTLSLIERLGSSVKLYRLRCSMEPEAAQVAYNGMNERKDSE